MEKHPASDRGRGTALNPAGRFEPLEVVYEEEHRPQGIPTRYYRDNSKSVLSTNDSPDIGVDVSLNPYRGCEHGCIYCHARPTHEYLGLSCGLDFETKIFVKPDAAKLLRKALRAKSWKPQVIAFSGVTDPYQPAEKSLRITRECLKVLAEFRNPVGVISKNHLITRDIDILQDLASHQAVGVSLSVTTLDTQLAGKMEPRASRPAMRLRAKSATSGPSRVVMSPGSTLGRSSSAGDTEPLPVQSSGSARSCPTSTSSRCRCRTGGGPRTSSI